MCSIVCKKSLVWINHLALPVVLGSGGYTQSIEPTVTTWEKLRTSGSAKSHPRAAQKRHHQDRLARLLSFAPSGNGLGTLALPKMTIFRKWLSFYSAVLRGWALPTLPKASYTHADGTHSEGSEYFTGRNLASILKRTKYATAEKRFGIESHFLIHFLPYTPHLFSRNTFFPRSHF